LNRVALGLSLIILLLFTAVVLQETNNQSIFNQSTPPDPLMKDLAWIREQFGDSPKIIIAPGYWPDGVFPAFLGWAMVYLNIDMKSSFVYIGQLGDLLEGKPSDVFYGFPSNEIVIKEPQRFHILVLNYDDDWLNFYTPSNLESRILKSLKPNVYEVDFTNPSVITQWCSLVQSINQGRIPQGERGYVESSFTNWTGGHGDLDVSGTEARFIIWQNETEGWIENRNLNLSFTLYPYMFLRVNTFGGKLEYIDFYNSQSELVGRGNLYSSTLNYTIVMLDLRTFVAVGNGIYRMAIVFSSNGESRVFQLSWLVFMGLPF
jgi:hypothetical protein